MQNQFSKFNFSINAGLDSLGDSPPIFVEGGLYFGTVNANQKLQEYKLNTNGLADNYKSIIVLQANGNAEDIASKLAELIEKTKQTYDFEEIHETIKFEVKAIGYQFIYVIMQLANQSQQQQAHSFIKFLTVGQATLFAKNNYMDFGLQLRATIQSIFTSSNPLATIFEAFRIYANINFDKDFPMQLISTYIDFFPQEAKQFVIPLTLFKGIKIETFEGGSGELDQDLIDIFSTLMTQQHLEQFRNSIRQGGSEVERELLEFLKNNIVAKGDIYVNSPIAAAHINYNLSDLSKFYFE